MKNKQERLLSLPGVGLISFAETFTTVITLLRNALDVFAKHFTLSSHGSGKKKNEPETNEKTVKETKAARKKSNGSASDKYGI